ncbi:multivesicular body subunit 12Ba isoform X8 [Phycodurus eques]|uniref:multivesicular body subunit 12Ba isoform X8 n=1 Tax=Phycodurus eques TaxID=693459 RepID=UPI002ACEC4D1|nr:multivesicular body subunit 12Ba isoform X8 [Phycodurus eques]
MEKDDALWRPLKGQAERKRRTHFLEMLPYLKRHFSMTLPASFRGKNTTRPDYEHQNSNFYAISAMDGVPFMISEKFACASSELQQVDLIGITIKTLAEIEKERRDRPPSWSCGQSQTEALLAAVGTAMKSIALHQDNEGGSDSRGRRAAPMFIAQLKRRATTEGGRRPRQNEWEKVDQGPTTLWHFVPGPVCAFTVSVKAFLGCILNGVFMPFKTQRCVKVGAYHCGAAPRLEMLVLFLNYLYLTTFQRYT